MSEVRELELSAPGYVEEQYRDTTRLDLRLKLYERYRPPGEAPLSRWTFDGLRFPPNARVLEVGGGKGGLWLDNIERIPADLDLTLTDISPAMVTSAQGSLGSLAVRATFRELDVVHMPYVDASFDVLIANHMLYHVADRLRALEQLRRVLRPGGVLYATTNAWTHLVELREVCERFCDPSPLLPVRRAQSAFDVETGARELERVFRSVHVRSRYAALVVDDAGSIVDYVASMLPEGQAQTLTRLREHVRWWIEREGGFRVTTAVAQLIAS